MATTVHQTHVSAGTAWITNTVDYLLPVRRVKFMVKNWQPLVQIVRPGDGMEHFHLFRAR